MLPRSKPQESNRLTYSVLLLLVIALAAQGVVGYFTYSSMNQAVATAVMVSHTNQVRRTLEQLHSQISDTESARRGWLLTGDGEFARSHKAALAEIDQQLAELRRLTADNPAQQRNLDVLEPMVREKEAHMANLDRDLGVDPRTIDTGRTLMAGLRRQMDVVETLEAELLSKRQIESDVSRENALRMLLLGSLLSLGLVTCAMVALALESRRRHTAEAALRQSEEDYRTLVANIPDISWTAGADGEIDFISENVADITGFTSKEIIEGGVAMWVERLHPDERAVLVERLQALFTDNQKYDYEYRFQRKDGQWIWLHARAHIIFDKGGRMVTSGILSEITLRKLAEEQNVALRIALEDTNRELERASRLKSQFLASMSHELRTPLNAIVGFSDLLAEETAGALNEKQKRFVNHVKTGAGHLLRLINDILDISKIEAGHMDLHLETLDLEALLPEVLSLVRPLAMHGNVHLNCGETKAFIRADRVRLKQVLYNLLSNAIKFTPAGGKVKIECRQQKELTFVSVEDTGLGIRPEDQKAIFEEFRQVGESSKGITEGTGLGLAITSRIVSLHGGEIWVESQLGEGSRFTFTVPTATAKNAQPEGAEDGGGDVPYRELEEAPLILIIDDEPSACELISTFLTADGYRCLTANSAAEGLALARKHRPDLITLDILMPDGNGFGSLFELRADPNTSAIPIVVISIVDQKKTGISFGAKEYLVKPIEKSALITAVERQLGKLRREHSVLVVDDDSSTSAIVCEELSTHGYRCQSADGGAAALEYLRQNPVDLILLDLMMPGMNGFEVLKGLASDERLSAIPVIVITAKNLSAEEIQILKRETRGYIEKTGPWAERVRSDIRRFLEPAKVGTA